MATATAKRPARVHCDVEGCTYSVEAGQEASLYNKAQREKGRRNAQDIYCPLGHSFVFLGESDADKERRLRKQAEDQAVAERARADQAEASLRTTKGHVTRLRNRVLAGECPLCGHHLRDVARHVARMHPGETSEAEA